MGIAELIEKYLQDQFNKKDPDGNNSIGWYSPRCSKNNYNSIDGNIDVEHLGEYVARQMGLSRNTD